MVGRGFGRGGDKCGKYRGFVAVVVVVDLVLIKF